MVPLLRELLPFLLELPAIGRRMGLAFDRDPREQAKTPITPEDRRAFCESVGLAVSLGAADHPLRQFLPGLDLASEAPFEVAAARAANALERRGLKTCGQLGALTLADLRALRGIGTTTVLEILTAAADVAIFGPRPQRGARTERDANYRPAGGELRDLLPLLEVLPPAAAALGLTWTSDGADLAAIEEGTPIGPLLTEIAERLEPERTLVGQIPGLRGCPDDPVEELLESARAVNIAAREGIVTFGQLGEYTPAQLYRIRGAGTNTVVEWLCAALEAGLFYAADAPTHGADSEAESGAQDEDDPGAELVVALSEGFRLAAAWATEAGLPDLRAMTDADVQARMPQEVRSVLNAIGAVRPDLVADRAVLASSVVDGLRALWNCVDPADRPILDARPLSLEESKPTLAELAEGRDVTRERIRQMEARGLQRLRAAASEPGRERVRWHAEALRQDLGTQALLDHPLTDDLIARALGWGEEPDRPLLRRLLLWLAGPYTPRPEGWISLHDVPSRELRELADEHNLIEREHATRWLLAQGIQPVFQDAWLRHERLRIFDDHVAVWGGSAADKCVMMLALRGSPATADQLVEQVGEGHNSRGVRNQLGEDARLMRVDRTRWALRAWGLEEYTGIVEEIRQRIVERGGSAVVSELVTELATLFGVAEASVRVYADAPMFVRDADKVRLRGTDEPYEVRQTIESTRGLFQIGPDRISYTYAIDGEILRGSGRTFAPAAAAFLGVLPGGRRSFDSAVSSLLVSWPDSSAVGPTVGSLRDLVNDVGAESGDGVRLEFDRASGTVTATRIPRGVADDDTTQPLARVWTLTGVLAEPRDVTERLATAIGVTVSDVQVALRRRGDGAIAELLPRREVGAGLQAALDEFESLLARGRER